MIRGELHPRRAGKQISRKVRRQSREQLASFRHEAHLVLRTRIVQAPQIVDSGIYGRPPVAFLG